MSVKAKLLSVLSVICCMWLWEYLWKIIRTQAPDVKSDPNLDFIVVFNVGPLSKSLQNKYLPKLRQFRPKKLTPEEASTLDMVEILRIYTAAVSQLGLTMQQIDSSFLEKSEIKDEKAKALKEEQVKKCVFHVSAKFDVLCKQATKMELEKETVGDEDERIPFNLQLAKAGEFKDFKSNRSFFTSGERVTIVEAMLESVKDCTDNRALLAQLVSDGLASCFPLHENEMKKQIFAKLCTRNPANALDDMAAYYGSEVALYFAFIDFYTKQLIIPAFFGMIIVFFFESEEADLTTAMVVYAVVLAVWGTVLMEFWKRTQATLIFRWGVSDDNDLLAAPRPAFFGSLRQSPITDKKETYYPRIFRYFKLLITWPIIGLCLLLATGLMAVSFWLEDYTKELQAQHYFAAYPFVNDNITFLPAILSGISVPIANGLYVGLANALTNFENHRTQMDHDYSHALKLSLFYFVNSYVALFCCAFWMMDLERLRTRLAALLITSQLIGALIETLVPFFTQKYGLYKLAEAEKARAGLEGLERAASTASTASTAPMASTAPSLPPYQQEAMLYPAGPMFDEYMEIALQFGYITMFGWCWPAAAFCALLNNIVEIRSDGFKLCSSSQRPSINNPSHIGVWQTVFEFLTVGAVVSNFALMGVYIFAFPDGPLSKDVRSMGFSDTVVCIALIGVEHLIVGLKVILAMIIPDVPADVEVALARGEYIEGQEIKSLRLAHLNRLAGSDPASGAGANTRGDDDGDWTVVSRGDGLRRLTVGAMRRGERVSSMSISGVVMSTQPGSQAWVVDDEDEAANEAAAASASASVVQPGLATDTPNLNEGSSVR